MTDHRMPFGKHKGQALAEIPTDYLRWAARELSRLGSGLKQAIREEVAKRDGTAQRQTLPMVPLAGPSPATVADNADLTDAIDRANASLDWFADNVRDIRRRLEAGEWSDKEPLDSELVAGVTADVGTAAVLLDPARIAEKAKGRRSAS